MTSFKNIFLKIRENNFFEAFVISVILISAIAVGFRTYEETFSPEIYLYLSYLDYFITTVFLVEIIIRLIAEDKTLNFFKDPWNVFDFTIVFISLIPIESLDSILLARLVRVFRLLRLVSFIPQFRILIESFVTAIPRVSYILLFMFVEFYIFAAIGSILFYCKPNNPYEHGSTWHQDNYAGKAPNGDNYLNLAVALDDAEESNGALKIVPGSHKLGDLPCNPKPNFSYDEQGRRYNSAPIGNNTELPDLPVL